jgi:hypothetical protein
MELFGFFWNGRIFFFMVVQPGCLHNSSPEFQFPLSATDIVAVITLNICRVQNEKARD